MVALPTLSPVKRRREALVFIVGSHADVVAGHEETEARPTIRTIPLFLGLIIEDGFKVHQGS